ncbi:hypothetical protein FRB98_003714, partial [Tulasnella sp. 332]
MKNAPGQRSYGVAEVPVRDAGQIRVHALIWDSKPADWERIAPAHMRDPKSLGPLAKGFVGVVASGGRHIFDGRFQVGDAVAGVVNARWVDALDAGDQVYLDVQVENVWRISTADVEAFGLAVSSSETR